LARGSAALSDRNAFVVLNFNAVALTVDLSCD